MAGDSRPGSVPQEVNRSARISLGIFFALLVWLIAAVVLPSPVGAYVPAVPLLAILSAIMGAATSLLLLRSPRKWSRSTRTIAVAGATVGIVISSGLGVGGAVAGCPTLHPFPVNEPFSGWQKASNSPWTIAGQPVLYFYGSVACPYCSASSWAVLAALQRFGNVSQVHFDHSSPTDVFPSTPSVVLSELSFQSQYVSVDMLENTNDQKIQAPTPSNCAQQAYVSAYDGFGAIPFIAVGGVYLHAGTLTDPGALVGLTAGQISAQIDNESGPAWTAIGPAADLLTAFLLKVDGGQPASLLTKSTVASDYRLIT